ncbi:MAG TPA: GAF domain-containing protein [Thermoanaerobaculia bacterium]|nr:GAF domain-containing protein [Thermoanaerobaculia bacterium]
MTAADKAESLRAMFRNLAERSRELRDDLIRENERLRGRVQLLETDLVKAEGILAREFEGARGEQERLSRETDKLVVENQDFARRYVELEEHATGLANLYAATFQLHATLDPAEVVKTITEIAINLIGAADFILYLTDDAKGDFVTAAREGELSPNVARLPALRHALEREAIRGRRTVFAEPDAAPTDEEKAPICCTPLVFRDRLVGVLTVYALLSHKKSFSSLDRELFDLLGDQAALAIVSSQCFVSVDRKLKTVQGFLDLLKS